MSSFSATKPRLISLESTSASPGGLRLNVSWAFAGNVVNAACQWGVLALFAKTLPTAAVGQFVFALALTSPIFVLSNLRLRNLLAAGVESPGGVPDFLRARLLSTAAALALAILAAVAFAPTNTDVLIVGLIAVAKSFDAVSDIAHGFFQRSLELRRSALGLMLNGASSLVLVLVTLTLFKSVTSAVAAYALGSLIATLLWDVPNASRMASLAGEPALRLALRPAGISNALQLLRVAAPLGLSTALGSFQASLPRFAVAAALGPSALAVFGARAYVNVPTAMVVNAIGQAALPALADEFRGSRDRYWRLVARLTAVGLLIGATLIGTMTLFGTSIISVAYTAEYARYNTVLMLIVAASSISSTYILLATATTARGSYSIQFWISVASTAILGLLVMPSVRSFGLSGAAGALVAVASFEAIAYGLLTMRSARRLSPTPCLVRP